jgi:hypothetical protein
MGRREEEVPWWFRPQRKFSFVVAKHQMINHNRYREKERYENVDEKKGGGRRCIEKGAYLTEASLNDDVR